MDICVVGGTGFIGRHLCERLHEKRLRAFTVSRSPDLGFLSTYAPSVPGFNVDDPAIWERLERVKSVIYLAGNSKPGWSWRAPDQEIGENVVNLARFVRRILDANPSCNMIYASSGGTIYGGGYDRPIRESDPVAPATSYALGKLMGEQTLEFFTRLGPHGVTVLRIANPVGKWQLERRHGLISTAIRCCQTGEALTVYGDGHNLRDYIDAEDLADLFIAAALTPFRGFRVLNAGSGVGATELQAIDRVVSAVGRQPNLKFQAGRPFDLRYAVLDPALTAETLDWRSKSSLDEVIHRTLERSQHWRS